MRKERFFWQVRVIAILVTVSILLYIANYMWFRDLRHLYIWSLTSLAFLPISALVVALLVNRVLASRDKALRLEKLNMLIGIFFSTIGNQLLLNFSDRDPEDQYLRNHFGSPQAWSKLQPKQALVILGRHSFEVTFNRRQISDLKTYLAPHVDFLMRLIENPYLLEHESFTKLMRTLFHLAEELSYRTELEAIPDADLNHLTGDIQRAYNLIVREWVLYMIALKRTFPFLFSLAVRMNPLDRSADAVVPDKVRTPDRADESGGEYRVL